MKFFISVLKTFFSLLVILTFSIKTTFGQSLPNQKIEEIIVNSHPLSAEGLAQPISILSGDTLNRVISPSLAETLRDIPGIHSSNFGAAVGKPVIRGLGGPRVKVMEDRIDSLDVSVSSPEE